MKQLTIESNGRLGKTAIYINGEQLAGLKELFLNLDEDGAFDSVIQYVGIDGNHYTKNIFSDQLTSLQITDPTMSEEEAMELEEITISSDGYIENTLLAWNEEELEGVVSMLVHIKAPTIDKGSGISSIFKKEKVIEAGECKAEIVFRNEDDSIETEVVF